MASKAGPSKTSQTQKKRRQMILSVAREIVSKQGGEALNMKELASIADVPRATLYRYYASKEQLISDMALDWGNSLLARLQENAPTGKTFGEKVSSVFESILKEAKDNPNLIAITLSSLLSDDSAVVSMQSEFERLLPALMESAVDYSQIEEVDKVIDVLLRLLLANLMLLSLGRGDLQQSLDNMVFAAQGLMGSERWNSAN